MNTKEIIFDVFQTQRARSLAREIDNYLYHESPYANYVEDYHNSRKDGARTDCIGYISKKGSYKFLSITTSRKHCVVLHLGKKLHTATSINMQHELDNLLKHRYQKSDNIKPTPGEAYIRLEWVDELSQIISFIDKAYSLRLEK